MESLQDIDPFATSAAADEDEDEALGTISHINFQSM